VTLTTVADILAILAAAAIIFIGASYLLAPEASAKGFGLPDWPTGTTASWLNVKGVRDIVSGLLVLALLVAGERRILGVLILVEAIIPIGDAIIVLRYRGVKALAYGMHAATAAVMVAIAALLLAA
jgi:Domain of unknown function (DUF4267)